MYTHKEKLRAHLLTFCVLFLFSLLLVDLNITNGVYATTFTPNISKRNSDGPMTSGITLQGNITSGSSDTVIIPNSSLIAENPTFWKFTKNFDIRQGTIVFWLTPEYSSSDLNSGVYRFAELVTSDWAERYHISYDYVNDRFIATFGGNSTVLSQPISAYNTYLVIVRYDMKNTLNGSSGVSITVNDASTGWGVYGNQNMIMGSTTLSGKGAGFILEGLTIYRRPLFDGTYGIDVGNGDEMNLIYNSGVGTDPTKVTGSWDVTFSLPTNDSIGTLSEGAGNAWSHPHSSNLLYTDTTDTGGFMMNGTYTTDGWNIANWYNSSWSKRKSITINESMVSGSSNLTSFPILICVTDAGLASDAQDDGDDIVFTSSDGLTKLNHEIESFNGTTGELVAWVNVPTLNATTDTTLYMYYGNDVASNQQSVTATWNSSYKAVWHMNQDPSGTAPQLLDSTQNNNDGTSNGTMTSGDAVAGKIGKAVDFDGSDDYMQVADNASLQFTQDFTLSAWVNRKTATYGRIISRMTYSSSGYGFEFWDNKFDIMFYAGGQYDRIAGPDVLPNQWQNIVVTKLGTAVRGYLNGVEIVFPDASASTLTPGVNDLLIGYGNSSSINGIIDNVRLLDTALTPDWILTEYNNQNSPATYLTFSSEQSIPSVSANATGDKIYAGGYKVTSGANLGIYRTFTATSGGDYVLRALGHSDSTCNPKIKITRADGTTEISHLSGTTTSTRTDPDVYIFTWESPAAEANQIQLLNTASSGTCYWHQVEVLPNRADNPSQEDGGGTPYAARGWTNDIMSESARSTDTHSGQYSSYVAKNSGGYDWNVWGAFDFTKTINKFYGGGYFAKVIDAPNIFEIDAYPTYIAWPVASSPSWKGYGHVWRQSVSGGRIRMGTAGYPPVKYYFDDMYIYENDDVPLTVTPASLANSTENTDEIRVDGSDTYVTDSGESYSIFSDNGFVSFDYRPRHSSADISKFGEATPYIISLYGDSNDYINVYWDSNNSITLAYSMNGTTASGTWDATNQILSNTKYSISLSYTGGSTMSLSVGGTNRITLSSIPSAFGTSPNTVNFGSSAAGLSQGDAAYSNIYFVPPPTSTPTPTRTPTNTPTPTPTNTPFTSPWTQTNWVDGDGQTNYEVKSKFLSSSSIDYSTPGEIKLVKSSNWLDDNWNFRSKITFNNSDQNENLQNFPVLIKLNSNRIDYTKTQNSGDDLRFTDNDGQTQLSYEIEKWNESGDSFVWVKVPQINASSNTDYIYMYYGNSSATTTQSPSDVWGSAFDGVWHLSESSTGQIGEFIDSSGDNHHGQGGAAYPEIMVPTMAPNAYIGNAQLFDGENDYIKIPQSDSLFYSGTFTVSAWVRRTGAPSSQFGGYIFSDYDASGNVSSFALRLNGPSIYATNSVGFLGSNSTQATSTTVLSLNTWYQVVGVWDGTYKRIYINGIQENTSNAGETRSNTHANLGIGRPGDYPGLYFPGYIDEVRIASGTKSSNWIKAQYLSESDSFNTFNAEESIFLTDTATLTSSIYDTGFRSNWGNLTYTKLTPSGTTITVKSRSSNSPTMSGATDFSLCSAIASGEDVSSNNCTTDNQRFIQYQVIMNSDSFIQTPVFYDLSIPYVVADSIAPNITILPLSPDPGNNKSPTFFGTVMDGEGSVANLQYQIDGKNGLFTDCVAIDSNFDSSSEEFKCVINFSLADGAHTVYFRSIDSNGNITDNASYPSDSFTIDTASPTLDSIDSPNMSNMSSNPVFKFSLATDTGGSGISSYGIVVNQDKPVSVSLSNIPFTSSESSSEIILKDDSEARVVLIGKNTSDTSDDKLSLSFPYFASHSLPDGENTFKLTVRDNAGNTLTKELMFNVGNIQTSEQCTVNCEQRSPTPTINIQALNLTSELDENSLDLVRVSAEDDISPKEEPKQKVSPSITPTPTMILEITDTSGKPIPDTMIKIEGVTDKAVSDKEGNIILSSLAPGTYKIQIISKEDGSVLGEQTVNIDEEGVKKIRITIETDDSKNSKRLNIALASSLLITFTAIIAYFVYKKMRSV